MTTKIKAQEHDEWVWVRMAEGDDDMYLPGHIREKPVDGDDCVVEVFVRDRQEDLTVSRDRITPIRSSVLDSAPELDDLVMLEDFTEVDVLHCLRMRYFRNIIYTRCSNVMIGVNPNKDIPKMYDHEKMDSVRGILDDPVHGLSHVKPHPFALAHVAYRQMSESVSSNNQSIVISGESGAGKTETAKIILRYLSYLNQRMASDTPSEHEIERKIIAANPIIEAFGNAKTVMNMNSSRFGKWIEIMYTDDHRISGATLVHYLLEKARVVRQCKGERNFHIFYQLFAAAHMKRDEVMAFCDVLTQSHAITHQNDVSSHIHSDEDNVERTFEAMRNLGFSETFVQHLIIVLVALLRLGDIVITTVDDECAHISDVDPSLLAASELLGVASDELLRHLTWAMRKDVAVPLTAERSRSARDGLVKQVYSMLFDHLINRINASLSDCGSSTTNSTKFVGILDIYGFEVFQINSLGQLFINYANEKLHQHFLDHVIQREVNEFREEGLSLPDISVKDNGNCVLLLESMLGTLNDLVTMPKGDDLGFVATMNGKFGRFREYKPPRMKEEYAFVVKHFAGKVKYNAKGFVDTNRDSVLEGLQACIRHSSVGFVRTMVTGAAERMTPVKLSRSQSGKLNKFLSTKFRMQLDALMEKLKDTDTTFLRCVKPNGLQCANKFVAPSVLTQLKYCGIDDLIRLRQRCLPLRIPFRKFIDRFSTLVSGMTCQPNATDRDVCEAICGRLGMVPQDRSLFLGNSKVFLSQELYTDIQLKLRERVNSVLTIQAFFRMHARHERFLRVQRGALCVQAAVRATHSRKRFADIQRATLCLQALLRTTLSKKYYTKHVDAVKAIQAAIRTRQRSQKCKIRFESALKIQKMWRTVRARRAALILQTAVLVAINRRKLLKLRQQRNDKISVWMRDTNSTLRMYQQKHAEFGALFEELQREVMAGREREDRLEKQLKANEHHVATLENALNTLKSDLIAKIGGFDSVFHERLKELDGGVTRRTTDLEKRLCEIESTAVSKDAVEKQIEKRITNVEGAVTSAMEQQIENVGVVMEQKMREREENVEKRISEIEGIVSKSVATREEQIEHVRAAMEVRIREREENVEKRISEIEGVVSKSVATSIQEHIEHVRAAMIARIHEREENVEKRIFEIEGVVSKSVATSIEEQIEHVRAAMEASIRGIKENVEKRISEIEGVVSKSVAATKEEQIEKRVRAAMEARIHEREENVEKRISEIEGIVSKSVATREEQIEHVRAAMEVRIREREENVEKRISEIEGIVSKSVATSIQEHIEHVRAAMIARIHEREENVEKRISEIEGVVSKSVATSIEEQIEQVRAAMEASIRGIKENVEKQMSEIEGVVSKSVAATKEEQIEKRVRAAMEESIREIKENVEKRMSEIEGRNAEKRHVVHVEDERIRENETCLQKRLSDIEGAVSKTVAENKMEAMQLAMEESMLEKEQKLVQRLSEVEGIVSRRSTAAAAAAETLIESVRLSLEERIGDKEEELGKRISEIEDAVSKKGEEMKVHVGKEIVKLCDARMDTLSGDLTTLSTNVAQFRASASVQLKEIFEIARKSSCDLSETQTQFKRRNEIEDEKHTLVERRINDVVVAQKYVESVLHRVTGSQKASVSTMNLTDVRERIDSTEKSLQMLLEQVDLNRRSMKQQLESLSVQVAAATSVQSPRRLESHAARHFELSTERDKWRQENNQQIAQVQRLEREVEQLVERVDMRTTQLPRDAAPQNEVDQLKEKLRHFRNTLPPPPQQSISNNTGTTPNATQVMAPASPPLVVVIGFCVLATLGLSIKELYNLVVRWASANYNSRFYLPPQ